MPVHVFLALGEEWEGSRSRGWDTRGFVLSSEQQTTSQPRGTGCPGLENSGVLRGLREDLAGSNFCTPRRQDKR